MTAYSFSLTDFLSIEFCFKHDREDGVMKASQWLALFFSILLVGFVLNGAGCGGSNINNPVSDTDNLEADNNGIIVKPGGEETENAAQTAELDTTITVTDQTVRPGGEVELTASVKGVRGSSVVLNWLNITGHGTLSASDENPVTWNAPSTLNEANAQVEVIQLVVTVISEIVSVGSSGIETDTQIFSETKTVLLTVKDE